MLPTITQRLLMLAAIILGTVCWLPVLPLLTAADGSSGLSLLDARVGVFWGCVALFGAGLPALLAGLYVSSSGNPLSGIFTLGLSLMVLAGYGGSMNGLVWRQAERAWTDASGGSIFMQLEIEMMLWVLAWCLMMLLIRKFRPRIRHRLVPGRLTTSFDKTTTEEDTPRFVLQVRPAAAGLACAGLAWVLCRFLMQTHTTGQVIGSILLAFIIASLTARLALPTGNVVYLLMSPLLAGFVSYAFAAVTHGTASAEELIMRWQRGEIGGPMYAMPIHWASAGLIGVTIGIGMAQAIDRVRVEENGAAPTPTPDQTTTPSA